jgi:hypothetical protein
MGFSIFSLSSVLTAPDIALELMNFGKTLPRDANPRARAIPVWLITAVFSGSSRT